MLKSLIKISLLLFPTLAIAQKDTTKLSFKKYYVPTGIRVGVDLIPIGQTMFNDSFTGKEFQADIDLYRYFVTLEYGNSSRSYQSAEPGKTFDYKNDGTYFRIGVDVNFLVKDPDRNMFFVGLRYGRSNFNENYFIDEALPQYFIYAANPVFRRSFVNSDVPARWFELTTGVKVKIYKFVWMGYTARFKFGLKNGDTPELLPHDVPGYGRTDKDSAWGFSYHIMFRIPVRDYPPLPVKKKKKK